jgi:hypothetical protein
VGQVVDEETLRGQLAEAHAEIARLRAELAAERGRAEAFQAAHADALAAVGHRPPAPARSSVAERRARLRDLHRLGFSYDPIDGWRSPDGRVFESPADALAYAQSRDGVAPVASVSRDSPAASRPVASTVAPSLALVRPPPSPSPSSSPSTPTPLSPLPSSSPDPSLREGDVSAVPVAGAKEKKRTPKPPSTTADERAAKEAIEAAYLAARGEPYPWGADDWTNLRRCLTLAADDLAVLLERWGKGLELGAKWPGCSKLRQLAANWGDLLAHLQAPSRRVTTRERRAAVGGDVPDVPGMSELYAEEGEP